MPLGLRLLVPLTGLVSGESGVLRVAYDVARTLADTAPLGDDCDPTYQAVSRVIAEAWPEATKRETSIARAFARLTKLEDPDDFGRVILARTDASFLLGFVYCYVCAQAIGGKEDHG